jgi:Bacterial SH3 domain
MARPPVLLLVLAALLYISGCKSQSQGPPPIAEAYVGPVTLSIRQDLSLKSPVTTTAKHGDRLDVLQMRRRFVKVRTSDGVTGWVDSRQLISTEQMQALRRMAEDAAKMPVQGRATVFEALNIHSEPVRTSPSFAQLPEGGSVDVLAHRIAPRNAQPQAALPILPPKLPPPRRKKGKNAAQKERFGAPIGPPPLPPPPPPPPNWLQLSQSAPPEPGAGQEKQEKKEETPAKPVPIDDWTFVRTKDGKAGWVLSRMLAMSIPDEVAQYAEGHRITSYFPLADVQDDGQTRHYWLWTTLSKSGAAYEFDSFRVFVWSLKHHRYETAYIDRKVIGYYPVEATKGTGEKGEGATFSLILDDDGQLVKKTYVFNGYRVNLLKKEPWQTNQQAQSPSSGGGQPGRNPEQAAAKPGLFDRLKKLFGK